MKKLFTLTMLFAASFGFAQDAEEKKLSLSGSVDTYYRTNLTSTDQVLPVFEEGVIVGQQSQNPGTSFANETGFALGMANIIAAYEGDKVGAVADVVFGPRGNDAITGNNINQLYAYWNVSEKTTLTLGRFNTYLGYEVISPVGNFNYSTSYLFSNGPFSHVGLKADFALSDDFSLMLAAMNVTDTDSNITGDYAFGAQLGYKGQFLNFYYDGADPEVGLGFEIDYTGGFDISDEFYLGINAAYNIENDDAISFYGAALYPQYALSDDFSIGLRGELFGRYVDGADDNTITAFTLTGSYTVDNLTIKPELRLDSVGNDIEPFVNNDLEATNSLASFTLAAIYAF